jgi:hypothetical protein
MIQYDISQLTAIFSACNPAQKISIVTGGAGSGN